jgi:PTS system fructose-specific IIA component
MRHRIDVTGIVKAALDRNGGFLGCGRDAIFGCHDYSVNRITVAESNIIMAIALADLIDPRQIALNLRARTQAEAIRELVQVLATADKINQTERFLEELRAREAVNSTYAADGVAFPHARTKLVDQIVLAIGRSETGIPWTGKGEIARLVFLIAVPERLISDYLVVVGAIARITRDAPLRTLLLHAENADEFVATLLGAPSI